VRDGLQGLATFSLCAVRPTVDLACRRPRRRDNDGGNTFTDFVLGVVLLLAFLILLFDL
jgi:hypothetical protein